jgi:hypothetical protein
VSIAPARISPSFPAATGPRLERGKFTQTVIDIAALLFGSLFVVLLLGATSGSCRSLLLGLPPWNSRAVTCASDSKGKGSFSLSAYLMPRLESVRSPNFGKLFRSVRDA